MKLIDDYKHKGMRMQLVKELKQKGINTQYILNAIEKVPRHFFIDSALDFHAYEDKAFPIEEGQTISQPYTVAYQTTLLDANSKDKILEIGTGSGYQACILLEIGGIVHTIEYNKILFNKAKKLLPSFGYHPHFYLGDGSKGLPEHAPFDRIIVTAGAPNLPKDLIDQLKIGGKLVVPIGNEQRQTMMRFTKISSTKIKEEKFDVFKFVPLKGEKGWR